MINKWIPELQNEEDLSIIDWIDIMKKRGGKDFKITGGIKEINNDREYAASYLAPEPSIEERDPTYLLKVNVRCIYESKDPEYDGEHEYDLEEEYVDEGEAEDALEAIKEEIWGG